MDSIQCHASRNIFPFQLMKKLKLLLIEDDLILGESLKERLELEGYQVKWLKNGLSIQQQFNPANFNLIICDLRLPEITGDQIFLMLKEKYADLPPFILFTGFGTISMAVEMLKVGVDDFLTKPLDIPYLIKRIKELVHNKPVIDTKNSIQLSPGVQHIESMLKKLIPHSELITLILGESGVGKEVCAERLHQLSCPDSPFEAINCAALPSELIGSELFGHEKGSFTGAISTHIGAFERAQDGVLFLDEIGDMNLDLQAQLLRVLEQRDFTRIGGSTRIPVKARIVCATNVNLEKLVQLGKFREDLYFRLNAVKIDIPPLRERPEDILWLTNQFIEDNALRSGKGRAPELSQEVKQAILDYHWPGNIRELKNAIDRACIFCDGKELTSELLGLTSPDDANNNLEQTIEQAERKKIIATLADNQYKIQQSADALGISRKGLWQKMKRLNINKDSYN